MSLVVVFFGKFTVGTTAKLNITGGTFSVNPFAYVESGYTVTQNGSTWTVVKNN